LLPMDLLLEKICHRAILRIYTLPEENPVVRASREAYRKRTVEKMPSPLRLLPRILGLPPPERVETIHPPIRPAHWTPPLNTLILKKEDATQSLQNDPARYKIYSDGSGFGGMAGAAAMLYKRNRPVPHATLRYQLGPLTEHTTFDAEGVGILLGIQLIERYVNNPNEKECLICLDGRSAIEALENRHPKSGQSIVESTLRAAKQAARSEQVEQLATVMWIPGHCGIE
ncbi:hypothetical protein EV361DRAFT_772090, partial [Lentinula raphanica]